MKESDASTIRNEIVGQGCVALEALKKHKETGGTESNRGKKKPLFPEQEESVFFTAKYKRIPLKRSSVHRRFIALPHSDKNPANTSLCLILPDLDRSEKAKHDPEVDKQAKEWAQILKKKFDLEGVDVAKIYTYTQLVREYSQHEDKAKLSNTYDLFLVDSKIMLMVFALLGQSFKRPGKMPFPVHSDRPSLGKEIMRAYGLVNLPTEALKDTVSVRIGNLSQSVEELAANLGAVVDKLLEHAAGGEKNIRACHIHLSNTETTLPIYVDFGSANEVSLQESRKRVYPTVEDECSALPDGLSVRVSADGEVMVIDEQTQEEVIYPTLDDEWEQGDDLKPRQREIDAEVKKRAKRALKETTTAAAAPKRKRPSLGAASVKKGTRSAAARKRPRPSPNAD